MDWNELLQGSSVHKTQDISPSYAKYLKIMTHKKKRIKLMLKLLAKANNRQKSDCPFWTMPNVSIKYSAEHELLY